LSSHREKFHHRAIACVFLGYPLGMKGYKLYDITSKNTFVSRDVVFHENVFPFHSVSFPTKVVDLFPDLVFPHSNLDSSYFLEHDPPIQFSDVAKSDSSSLNYLPAITVHKSSRISRPPSYLQDFHCNLLTNTSIPNSRST